MSGRQRGVPAGHRPAFKHQRHHAPCTSKHLRNRKQPIKRNNRSWSLKNLYTSSWKIVILPGPAKPLNYICNLRLKNRVAYYVSIFLVSRPRFCHLCQPWLFSKCVPFPSEKIRDTPACSSMSIPMYSRPVHTIYTTQLSPYVYLFMPDCSSSCGRHILPSGQFRSPEHKNNYLHVCSIYVRTYLMYVQS